MLKIDGAISQEIVLHLNKKTHESEELKMTNKSMTKNLNRRKGIRKNLTTYFSVRLLQGLIFAISFHYYMNIFGERSIEWKWMILTFPAWLVFGTIFLEMIPHFLPKKKSK